MFKCPLVRLFTYIFLILVSFLIGSWYSFTELTDGQWRIDVPLRIAVPLIVVSVVSWVVVFILNRKSFDEV